MSAGTLQTPTSNHMHRTRPALLDYFQPDIFLKSNKVNCTYTPIEKPLPWMSALLMIAHPLGWDQDMYLDQLRSSRGCVSPQGSPSFSRARIRPESWEGFAGICLLACLFLAGKLGTLLRTLLGTFVLDEQIDNYRHRCNAWLSQPKKQSMILGQQQR